MRFGNAAMRPARGEAERRVDPRRARPKHSLVNRRMEEAGVTRGRTLPAGACRAPTILLVDDHPPNLMALGAILEPLGVRLLYAGSGSEAVAIAASEDLALVLLDLQMPELDGLETAALLKKRCRTVPIIIVTADEPTRADVARGYATGAVDFLFKPLEPNMLRSKISAFLQLYEHRHASAPTTLPPRAEEGSGRLSERLVAAAPASDHAATVEALIRIHAALTEDLDVTKLAQRLASEAAALTNAAGAAFHYRVRRGSFRTVLVGRMQEELGELDAQCSVLSRVFSGHGALRCDDARASSIDVPRTVGSLVGVPAVARSGDVDGVLVLVHESAYAFDARDEELVSVAASYAAAAFENARLYEEAKEARHRAELAELELRAGEARLRIALESAGLGTWDYNPLSDTLRWDARCKSLAGLSCDAEVDYRRFLEGVHPEDRRRVDDAVKEALDPTTPNMLFDVEYRAVGIEDAVERWISSRGLAIAEQGRTVRFIGAMLDVTAKKRVEEERATMFARERRARAAAEGASRSKDEFLATVSHELRNPLNAILGWARVLVEERETDAERTKKGLDVILRNAKAQVQLVEDILEVSRIVTGKLRLSTGLMDVRAVVDAAVETVRAAAQAKRVSLVTRIVDSPLTIVADEDRVQQILWNLLSNAVKFTPPGGVVRVSVALEGNAVELVVSDSGEGIDADFLPYVFDRFRQFDGSTTRRHGGLGLGLAIVRHLTELHGGTVKAESEGRGRGASFAVTLPVYPLIDEPTDDAARPLASKPPGSKPEPHGALAGRRVLVLDDDADMRELIGMILEDAGARVDAHHDVHSAVRALEAEPPDVAVSDLAMPGEDGYAFARRIRTSTVERARRVPLVAMTAYARAEDRHRVLAGGFDRHVAKPIEPYELIEALASVLAGRDEAKRDE